MVAWRLLGERSFLALLACALVPGQVYHHAIFPISMCTFFVLLALSMLLSERWKEAGASGALAAMSYSTGFLVAPIAATYAASRSGRASDRARRAALAGGIAALGLAAVFLLHHFALGAWDAFLRVQAKYEHGLHSPLSTWLEAVSPLWIGRGERAPAVQALVVAAGIVALTAWRVARGLRSRDALLLGTGLVYWLFPLVAAGVSLYRADAMLVPALILLGDAPAPVNAAVCAGLAVLAFPMAELFFAGVLV
jgi:predicted membrane-bound dolichyl-phosphate-mannose-protein mannosyltransferase